MIPILALFGGCAPDLTSPRPIAYDHVGCDHCRMLISEPRFAAQLVTVDGDRRFFDDPACMFKWIADNHPSLAMSWFHDSTTADANAWLSWREVGFVEAKGTPMGGNWGAVPVGTEGAVSFGAASSRVLGGAK